MHLVNVLSKPYSPKEQISRAFDHAKRIKRECFGLKLAVLNRNELMFKLLWEDLMRPPEGI
jgi:hypothetical protein